MKKELIALFLLLTFSAMGSAQSQQLFYQFNNTPEDFSGNNNDGTIFGGVTQSNNFFTFDGSTAYVGASGSASLDSLVDGSFTFIVPFNSTPSSNTGNHHALVDYGDGQRTYWTAFEIIGVNQEGGLALFVDDDSNRQDLTDTSQAYNDGDLYCSAAINDVTNNNQAIWVNGTYTANSSGTTSYSAPASSNLTVGRGFDSSKSFDGSIHGVQLYEGVLSSSEIQDRCEGMLTSSTGGDGVIHESCLEEEREHSGLTEDVTGRIAGSGYPSRWGDKKA